MRTAWKSNNNVWLGCKSIMLILVARLIFSGFQRGHTYGPPSPLPEGPCFYQIMYSEVKSIYHKYYKNYPCDLVQEMRFVWFSLFWPKKVHFQCQMLQRSNLYVNQLFSADHTIECIETIISYLYSPWKYGRSN